MEYFVIKSIVSCCVVLHYIVLFFVVYVDNSIVIDTVAIALIVVITGDVDIIYTVITRLEISKLNGEIEKIDPYAFVVMQSVKDTKGGMIKKRSYSH